MSILIVFLIVVIIILFFRGSKSREGFAQVLGALAPVEHDLARCLSDAEKQNPNNRLLTPANLQSDRFCYQRYDTIGGNVCYDPCPVKSSTVDYCKEACNGNKGCMVQCACIKEVANWCANMWCPSSKMDSKDCIEQCINRFSVNCTSGRSWNWKI